MAATTTTSSSSRDPVATILNHAAHSYSFRFSPFLRQTYQVGLSPRPADMQGLPGGQLPQRHALLGAPRLGRPLQGRLAAAAAAAAPVGRAQLAGVQALAARPVQEGRAVRVFARVQPA
ncbi:uncharacterized protein TrAtP1_005991 [Trichoderma atroviride]|uniref:uncharacterized protein n=1 Tax=Hypocrea atroviridis TaxID=63577 RepID=UPI003321B553|nr:hypothetical protein TrAtP1_005991 [Trichoderma atroviride]